VIGFVTIYRPEASAGAGNALVQTAERLGAVCKVKPESELVHETTTFGPAWSIERRTGMVLIVRLQPPEMLPASGLASSTMNKLQVPFGSVPLKTDKDAAPGVSGAGGGKENWKLDSLLVGLNVPETSGPESGNEVGASSSKVRVTFAAPGRPPPTFDIRTVFWPSGPTRTMSTSSGKVWERPISWTVTLTTACPANPVTATVEP